MSAEVEQQHADMVNKVTKSGDDIVRSLSPLGAHWIHMALGVSGEAGELIDAIKKAAIYRRPLDLENVIEELGDLEFYMEGLRASMGITREETLKHNLAKLAKRYEGYQYTDQAAQERRDKQCPDNI